MKYLMIMLLFVMSSGFCQDQDQAKIEVGNKVFFNVPGEEDFEKLFEVDE